MFRCDEQGVRRRLPREVLHDEGIGSLASVTVPALDAEDRQLAAEAGLELAPVSLQQLIVRKTTPDVSHLSRIGANS